MRPVRMRPRNGSRSSRVASIRNGPASTRGAGTWLTMVSNSGVRSPVADVVGQSRITGAAAGVERREVELLVIGLEVEEQLEHLVEHFGGAGVGAVDLVDDDDRLEAERERLAGDELGLRHRPFGGVDQQDDAVDHRQDALDLGAEIGVAGGVDDVDVVVAVMSHSTLVHLARMVIPRSFSRSFESIARSSTRWLSRKVPDWRKSWSTSVVLP